MKKTKFKMAGNGSGIEKSSESSCLCASVLKKGAGTVEGGFNTETQRRRGTEFKMTEIGLIPEDWEVKRIGDMGQVVTGSTPPRNNSANWGGDFNWISAKDFNGKYISKTEEHITEDGKRFCRLLPENSVLVTCIASIGLNAITKKACATNQQINAVVCRVDSPEYLYYQICYRNGDLKLLAGQTAVPIIGKKQFEDVLIPVPPLPEQKKIAEALSDVDELLAAMTTLIEKKRAIKQGAMQELLGMRNAECGMRNVPRRRLPGFTGEWVEKRLGAVTTMFAGGTPSSSEDGYYGGNIPWVSISDISTAGKYIDQTMETLTEDGLNNSSAKWYPPNSLLFAMYASIGKCCIAKEKVTSSQAILGIYNLKDLDVEFLYYLLTFRNDEFLTMGQTGTQSNLSKSIVESITVNVPAFAEQRAIAEVLSDMDAEIAALEAKRAKYKSVKQGIMQELLTGKTLLKGV